MAKLDETSFTVMEVVYEICGLRCGSHASENNVLGKKTRKDDGKEGKEGEEGKDGKEVAEGRKGGKELSLIHISEPTRPC